MKAFIAARGRNEIECQECGARLVDSKCPSCHRRPGFWHLGRFWPTTLTEFEGQHEEIAKLMKCADLVVVDETMFEERQPRAQPSQGPRK